MIFFTLSHQPWEWPVAIAWIVGTQLWFYRRRHLLPLVLVHAVSNLSIFLFVLLANGRITDADGSPLEPLVLPVRAARRRQVAPRCPRRTQRAISVSSTSPR